MAFSFSWETSSHPVIGLWPEALVYHWASNCCGIFAHLTSTFPRPRRLSFAIYVVPRSRPSRDQREVHRSSTANRPFFDLFLHVRTRGCPKETDVSPHISSLVDYNGSIQLLVLSNLKTSMLTRPRKKASSSNATIRRVRVYLTRLISTLQLHNQRYGPHVSLPCS